MTNIREKCEKVRSSVNNYEKLFNIFSINKPYFDVLKGLNHIFHDQIAYFDIRNVINSLEMAKNSF